MSSLFQLKPVICTVATFRSLRLVVRLSLVLQYSHRHTEDLLSLLLLLIQCSAANALGSQTPLHHLETQTAGWAAAFQASGGDILLADVQGSSGRLSNKNMGIIIFDLMTHSPDEYMFLFVRDSPSSLLTGIPGSEIMAQQASLEVGDDDAEEE
ncbi:hypothetical protein DFH09DRAFT_1083534 [Mycena vulgaris]|nr:hypothetical protein DFH09DRAFT_1083534 [Mycena vulgaris]